MSSFILSAFADEIGSDLDLQIENLLKFNIHAVEFRSANGKSIADYTLEEANAAAEKLHDHDIAVSAIGSPIGKIGITDPFGPHLDKFRHVIDIAHEMEAPYIRMFSFYYPEGSDPADCRNQVMDRLHAMLDAADGSGVTLLHENEKGIYGDTAERCLDILTEMDSPMFRATYDFSNFVQCGVDNDAAFAMLRPYIEYVHMKDSLYTSGPILRDLGRQVTGNAHRPVGYGDGKVERILKALWRDGFEGYLSIEPHLGEEYGADGVARFAAAAEAAVALTQKISKLPAPKTDEESFSARNS